VARDESRQMTGLGRRACAILLAALPIASLAADQHPHADVPYVPTPWPVVDAMLKLANVGTGDYLIDLGSGDGRIVIRAAQRHGARGFGVEIDGALVDGARREAQRQGVAGRVEFLEQNLFNTDIGRATVVTMYLYPRLMMQLRPRLFEQLKPGARVVSHDFDMEGWKPEARLTVPVPDKPYGPPSSEVYLWVMPANAAGDWRWRSTAGGTAMDYEVTLEQSFQVLGGSAVAGGRPARFEAGSVRGDEIRFMLTAQAEGRALRHEFHGRVDGDAIRGTLKVAGAGATEWTATRTRRGSINIGER
jgi:hypothetical protein